MAWLTKARLGRESEAADVSRAGPGGQIRVADLIKHRPRIQAGELLVARIKTITFHSSQRRLSLTGCLSATAGKVLRNRSQHVFDC